jgi:hypothetical protein
MGKKIGFSTNEESPNASNEKKKPDPLSYSLLDEFCSKYMPALTAEQSTNQFTTAEITKAISSFSGDRNLRNDHIKDELISKGYKYCVEIEGYKLVFKWMLKEVL